MDTEAMRKQRVSEDQVERSPLEGIVDRTLFVDSEEFEDETIIEPTYPLYLAQENHTSGMPILFDEHGIASTSISEDQVPYVTEDTGLHVYIGYDQDIRHAIISQTPLSRSHELFNHYETIVPMPSMETGDVSYTQLVKLENRAVRRGWQHETRQLKRKTTRLKRQVRAEQDKTNSFRVLASYDELTEVLNQSQYLRDRQKHIKWAVEHQEPVHVVQIDLKKLTDFNNIYGHQVGSDAIKAVAQTLKESFRREDIDFVYRSGGDEFTVVSRGSTYEGLQHQVQEFYMRLSEVRLDNPELMGKQEIAGVVVPQSYWQLKVAADVGFSPDCNYDPCKMGIGPEDLRGRTEADLNQVFDAVYRRADAVAYDVKNQSANPNQEVNQFMKILFN